MIVDDVRKAAASVCRMAQTVRVDERRLDEYADFLLGKYPLVETFDGTTHLATDDSARAAAYVIALDSVNFGSGWFWPARQRGCNLEYGVIAGGLKTAFLQGKMDTPEKWTQATAEDCGRMFDIPQGLDPQLDRLQDLFAAHLNMTGRILLREFGGDPLRLVAAASGSATALVEIVSGWESFRDASVYRGFSVPLFKRAQILAADLHLALGGGLFSDMDSLTIFADNMVPHVLRHDGILHYSGALAEKIDGRAEIASGSADEVELRACAIHAVELLKASAARQGHAVTSVNLDHILWARGYEPEIHEQPPHRTLTTCY